MSTENTTPTNETTESASQEIHGGDIGGDLNVNDLAGYLSAFTDGIPKAYDGIDRGEKQEKRPSPFDVLDGTVDSDTNENQSDDELDGLELDALESDSKDTNESEAKDETDEPIFEIEVDGKKFEVKQTELIADAQKYRAATNRHTEAVEMRKAADEIKTIYSQEREVLNGLLTQYQKSIEDDYAAKQPDWNDLYANNPLEYFKQKEYWQGKQLEAQQAKAYQDDIRRLKDVEANAQMAEFLNGQRAKLYELFPSWKNPEVAQKASKGIETYLTNQGFNSEELHTLNDARMLMVAHKAALYDRLVEANGKKKGNNAPISKTLNAGTATTNDPGLRGRQNQTKAAREAKGWNDSLRADPSKKNFESYLADKWSKKK